MRVPIYTVAIPLLAALAFAQDTQPQKPPAQPATADQTPKEKKADKQMDKDNDKGTALPELKTLSYSGTLMDASCAGSSSTPTPPTASADRSAPSAGSPSCTVSTSTSQFALKMQDGKTVKFDDVGNMRAQEAFKAHKKWSDNATANKPVRVKATGVLDGDKLTVMSIN